MSDKTTF